MPNQNLQQKIMALLRIVEGISRSLNNLLERFHQSFFFYVIISSDRFISIGDYMPSIGLMAGSLLIKSFLLWLKSGIADKAKDDSSQESNQTKKKVEDSEQKKENLTVADTATQEDDAPIYIVTKSVRNIDVLKVGIVFFISHLIGVLALFITTNKFIHDYLHSLNVPTQTGIFYLMTLIFAVSLLAPRFLRLNFSNGQFLNVVALIELGTMLLSVSLLNFSLGFFLCSLVVPFAIITNVQDRVKENLFVFLVRSLGHLLIHPLIVVYGIILAMSLVAFPELNFNHILEKSFRATVDGITYSVVDSLVSLI